MKRRHFMSAVVAVPALTALGVGVASAYDKTDYSRELYEAALASGEPFILDFYASW